jgi:hypothetical protein
VPGRDGDDRRQVATEEVAATYAKRHIELGAGVGPRRYLDLFSMRLGDGYSLRRKDATGLSSWDESAACVRVSMLPTSYLDREQQFAKLSEDLLSEEAPT